jgi:putative hydrolase of the HAD superfamily
MSFEIKAIIFDYGNVLCEPQPPEDTQAMAAALALANDKFLKIYWRDRVAYDRDDMNSEEYWNRVAGRQLDGAEIKKLVDLDNKSWTHPREEMIPWVGMARHKGLRTALLSNLPVPLRDSLEKDCPWLPRFDVRTYSCTLRKTKPDPEIYQTCVRELRVNPPEIVFLDDRQENVNGAIELGIQGLLFESPERAALDLSAQFGLSLRQEGRRGAR